MEKSIWQPLVDMINEDIKSGAIKLTRDGDKVHLEIVDYIQMAKNQKERMKRLRL